MRAKQALLFPDPRPLVDQFGVEFFRTVPERPGVYLMRDSREAVLYVGKAKNLRRRLNSYRVANPDRLHRRHLRLLRAVARIEWEDCCDEATALRREAALLRELRPSFNRAGTWPSPARFVGWKRNDASMSLGLLEAVKEDWITCGPLVGGAVHLYAAIARSLWLGWHPGRGASQLPAGWARGEMPKTVEFTGTLPTAELDRVFGGLDSLRLGSPDVFCEWARERASTHPFDSTLLNEDLADILRRFPKEQ